MVILKDFVASRVAELLHQIEGSQELREGLVDTPMRVARMYEEIYAGYSMNPKEILSTTFDNPNQGQDKYRTSMVIVDGIDFFSHCEHHMVPFHGKVHIAYIPKSRVVGISKFARLVDCFSKRLQIQERLTEQLAASIEKYLEPAGVMVVCKAVHLCMKMRGVKNATAETITSAVRGVFTDPAPRAECLALMKV